MRRLANRMQPIVRSPVVMDAGPFPLLSRRREKMRNEGMAVNTTNGVAVAGASTVLVPGWVPTLADVAGVAGLLVPILSVTWLALQIAAWLYPRVRAALRGRGNA